MDSIGIYIHIPFCNQRCPYCDFYSTVEGVDTKERYVSALAESISSSPHKGRTVDSIYFGGGTPTVLKGSQLSEILGSVKANFKVTPTAEISLEANPESSSPELLVELHKAGFNRVSFGVQSGVDGELAALGRLHSSHQAALAVNSAKKAGFQNISVDLMLGIPHQTQESIAASLDFVLGLPVNHVSAYMLSIEEGTPFFIKDMGSLAMEEGDLTDSYLIAVKGLGSAGFNQYEISNFAKPGGESRHNLKYWQSRPYLGFGPSAHSYMDGRRFAIPSDLQGFIRGDWHKVTDDGKGGDYAEYGMLRLRLRPGLDLSEYKRLYPEIDEDKILARAKELEAEGMIGIEDGVITFTPEGFLLSNYFIAQLLF